LLLLFLFSAADFMQGVEALRCIIRFLETIASLPLVLYAVALADRDAVSVCAFCGLLWGV
jgi:hypothetical protein